MSANDPERRSIQELFAASVESGLSGRKGDADAVAALHRLGTLEVLEFGVERLFDRDPARRAGAAAILGQLGVPARTFPRECVDALVALLEREDDPNVIKAAVIALGFLGDWSGLNEAARFVEHDDPGVRYAVAFALGSRTEAEATATLIGLMDDRDGAVRDWATFGLGQGEADSPTIREALFRRLTDSDDDVRFEAMCGLANRGDLRAAGAMVAALRECPDDLQLHNPAQRLLKIDPAQDVPAEELITRIERLTGGG